MANGRIADDRGRRICAPLRKALPHFFERKEFWIWISKSPLHLCFLLACELVGTVSWSSISFNMRAAAFCWLCGQVKTRSITFFYLVFIT
jgi:hypothetical protein